MTLGGLLDRGSSRGEVTGHVAGLERSRREAECLALTPDQQRRLWELLSKGEAAAGNLLAGAAQCVFMGRNSLRMLTRFEKWFARVDGDLVGCNRHVLSPIIGPGYFSVRPGTAGGLEFDYGVVPTQSPAGWPPVRSNTGALRAPVYGDLLDRVVWLSPDVMIGCAFRKGVALDSYFILVRSTR